MMEILLTSTAAKIHRILCCMSKPTNEREAIDQVDFCADLVCSPLYGGRSDEYDIVRKTLRILRGLDACA